METHIVAFPFPAQGHINPMIQFCKRLAFKGIKITLITFVDEELITSIGKDSSVKILPIPNKSDESNTISTEEDYWKDLKSKMSQRLSEIVAEESEASCPVSCLVYDSIMPWELDIAKQLGLAGAPFFTQSCAVSAIYYQIFDGKLDINSAEKGRVSLEGVPSFGSIDLPTTIKKYPHLFTLMANQFSNVKEADWIFLNSFNTLEEEVIKWMATQYPLKLVGPTIPSNYLDKRVDDNKDYGIDIFKPNNKSFIQEWLDTEQTSSIVYVSFGSLAVLGEKQMEEIASGLQMSNFNFLWVVRESEEEKLPTTFLEDTSTTNKGIVVSWCSQLEVLAHKSVGCFMTHCGWNSTLEALSLGVPMVAIPQWSDQTTNAKFVSDVWKIGVRVKVDEQGIVSKEEIDMCIREVMEGDTANEIRKNSQKWKKFAKEAVDEGGSSDKNINEFVAKLKCND